MKYRASVEISDKKILGVFQLLSIRSVRFGNYLCQFDFKKKIVRIDKKNQLLLQGDLNGGKSFSKLHKIIINDCVISIKKSRFSLIPLRDVYITDEKYALNIHGVSSSLKALEIGAYGSIDVDYLGRWVDCEFNEKHLIEAMVVTSFLYLFCNENRVSEG